MLSSVTIKLTHCKSSNNRHFRIRFNKFVSLFSGAAEHKRAPSIPLETLNFGVTVKFAFHQVHFTSVQLSFLQLSSNLSSKQSALQVRCHHHHHQAGGWCCSSVPPLCTAPKSCMWTRMVVVVEQLVVQPALGPRYPKAQRMSPRRCTATSSKALSGHISRSLSVLL